MYKGSKKDLKKGHIYNLSSKKGLTTRFYIIIFLNVKWFV